jgi:hypothetical protein
MVRERRNTNSYIVQEAAKWFLRYDFTNLSSAGLILIGRKAIPCRDTSVYKPLLVYCGTKFGGYLYIL